MDRFKTGSFRFSEGFIEAENDISAAAAAGTRLAGRFRRFCAACDSFRHIPQLYALCSGIAAGGGDVYVCENSELPSMRFSIPLLSADCGIFVSGGDILRMYIFGGYRLELSAEELAGIFSANAFHSAQDCGKIASVTTFRDIYTGNLRAALCDNLPSARISCGHRSVRELWESIFAPDDALTFNISGEGRSVTAFSERHGLISGERLILAYALIFGEKRTIWLPEDFHFSAERSGLDIRRFSGSTSDDFSLRMLTDPLFVCAHLASDTERLSAVLEKLPELPRIKREIVLISGISVPQFRFIDTPLGRVVLSRTGADRLLISAQADSMETAAELCNIWENRINRHGCGSASEKL